MPGNPYDEFLRGGAGTFDGLFGAPTPPPAGNAGMRQSGNAAGRFLGGGTSPSSGVAPQQGQPSFGGSPTNRASMSYLNPSSGGGGGQPQVAGYSQVGNVIGGQQQVGQYTSTNMDRGVQGYTTGSAHMNYGPIMGGVVPVDQNGNQVQGGGVNGQQGLTIQQLQQAALNDAGQQQAAADRQWNRNDAQNQAMERFLGGVRGDVTGSANRNAAWLDANANRYEGQGTEQRGAITDAARQAYGDTTGMIRGAERGLVDVESDIQGAYDRFDQSASSYRGAIDNYQDRGAQDASAMSAAIQQQFAPMRQQIEMGLRPDGTMMTPQERTAALSNLNLQVSQQVQSAITPLLSRYNDTVLNAEGSYSSLLGASGQARFAGAETRINAAGMRGNLANIQSNAGNNLVSGVAQGVQAQQQMAQLGSSLRAQGAAMRDAGMLHAVQLEMQGRDQLANMIRQNPESVVSTFNTLMGIYSLQNAQSTNAAAGGSSRPHIPSPTAQPAGGQQQQGPPAPRTANVGINTGQMGSRYTETEQMQRNGAGGYGGTHTSDISGDWNDAFDPYNTNRDMGPPQNWSNDPNSNFVGAPHPWLDL